MKVTGNFNTSLKTHVQFISLKTCCI